VWNYALERKLALYKETGKSIGYAALASELVKLKKQPETASSKRVTVSSPTDLMDLRLPSNTS